MKQSPSASLDRRSASRRAFTLIEIMIVVAILSVILGIAAPTWLRQRGLSQQRSCQETMVKIDGAKEQWAMENSQKGSAVVVESDIYQPDKSGYLKQRPLCTAGGTYDYQTVSEPTLCDVTDPYDHNNRP